MITVTEKAAAKAVSLAQKEGRRALLRLGVKGGGCSGMSYFFEFADESRAADTVWEVGGLTVVCDAKSMEFLKGCIFDFDSNLLKGGFRFQNPQAKRSCSCGESFSF